MTDPHVHVEVNLVRSGSRWAVGWMTGVLVAGGLGSLVLFVRFFVNSFALPGVEPENPVRGGWYLLCCAIVLVTAPLTATVIGVVGKQKIYATVCAILALGGLVLAGLMTPSALDGIGVVRKPPAPAPTPRISQCVERSGGDTRCPGG
ncbi:hypothetical protein GCM10010168_65550 [Actinoplanes ianthinogenes]|uniref:Uncharacterized protein n=1 Tax=Actinoplanes ianthinogenes TaxID=122358 RepID=A0ABN6CCE5_9ACTN|nr:hypothetical protein [Actinoplanes ianthinogenes]BCJ42069.1 hypothetical protein Aiant_27260 [Actinoplanes ianthinogenes]GGR37881.1 hypothetical protein GCM10010168_65550 [Actinoplanes ianthinogenes]